MRSERGRPARSSRPHEVTASFTNGVRCARCGDNATRTAKFASTLSERPERARRPCFGSIATTQTGSPPPAVLLSAFSRKNTAKPTSITTAITAGTSQMLFQS